MFRKFLTSAPLKNALHRSSISSYKVQARFFGAKASDSKIIPDVENQVMEITRNFLEGVKNADISKLDKDSTFEQLGLDSLDAIDLLVELEDSFGIDVSNEEAENRIKGIQDASEVFSEYVAKKKAEEETKN